MIFIVVLLAPLGMDVVFDIANNVAISKALMAYQSANDYPD